MRDSLDSILFASAWVVGAASLFFSIAESIGMWLFWPWVFRAGPRVLKEILVMNAPLARTGFEVETASGKVKFVAPSLCLFRCKMTWIGFDLHTPFPIKGSVRWDDTTATVEGRIPLFTTVFCASWLMAWTVGGLGVAMSDAGDLGGMSFLFSGWIIVGGMCVFSIPFEIRRARKVLSELKSIL